MESTKQKIKRNLKEGTFFKNVPIAIKNRVIKGVRTSNLFYVFDKKRVQTKKYEKSIKKLGSNGVQFGNYFLDKRIPLNSESIIYSLGILTDISFDLSIQKKYGCPVFMYDPTPSSIEFMKKYRSNESLKYSPVGVWIEDKTLRFYEPKLGGSATIMGNDESKGAYFEAECLSIETIMRKNQHDHISVFKADIEGAALPILKQMVENNLFPDQIVVEFERPKGGLSVVKEFLIEVSELRAKLKDAGYEEFLLPRKGSKYFSLEMLFVNKNQIV